MNSEDFVKGMKPVMKLSMEANIYSKTIWRHYKRTIAELTGKKEEDIQKELEDIKLSIQKEIEEEYINKKK